MSQSRFDAIVFDFDGVLVESVDIKTRAFAELYRPYGEAIVSQVVDYHLAHGGVSRYEKFHYFHEKLLNTPLPSEKEEQLAENFSQLVMEAVVKAPWVTGAKDFLIAWHDRIPLFVASGTPEEELKQIIARRGMSQFFRAVRGAPTTKGQILSEIIKASGYDAGRILMVGDAMSDYEGAEFVGAAFLGRVPMNSMRIFPDNIPTCTDLLQLGAFIR